MNNEFFMDIYIPNSANLSPTDINKVLLRTTHLCVAAHPDDVEIMAFHGINECFLREDKFFTAVIVTNGSGSDKNSIYSHMDDDTFVAIRKKEQQKAATIGDYNCVVFLDFSSKDIKNISNKLPVQTLSSILARTLPEVIYTHSAFDSHKTHIAVCNNLITAVKSLQTPLTIKNIYGCEVWGGLDWLPTKRKISLNVSDRINLQRALIGVFDTQISRGKSFDDACLGRRKANATFLDSHHTDYFLGITYALELIEIFHQNLSLSEYCALILSEFGEEKLKNLLLTDFS